MRRATVILLLILVVLGGGLSWWRHAKIPPRVNASEYESDMTEGLVRGVVRELGTGAPPVCFLAFGEGRTPPSSAFIARFANTYPAVRSSSSAASPPIGQYFQFSNGRPGLIVRIIRFREITPTAYDAVVSFSNLPAGRDHYLYRVVNQGGDWVVLSRKPE